MEGSGGGEETGTGEVGVLGMAEVRDPGSEAFEGWVVGVGEGLGSGGFGGEVLGFLAEDVGQFDEVLAS